MGTARRTSAFLAPENRRLNRPSPEIWVAYVADGPRGPPRGWAFVDMRNRARSHESKFDFLGFKFHLRAFKDNSGRFWIARQPSEKARKKLNQSLRDKLSPNLSLKQAKEAAENVWYGWCEYFRFSNANRVFYRQIRSVNRAVIAYLRLKYRTQRRPVPWRQLKKWANYVLREIKPVRVITDLVRQRKTQLSWLNSL